MGRWWVVRRLGAAAALAALVCAAQGCSPFAAEAKKNGAGGVVVSYFKWRFEDLFETIDLGLTISKKPYGGLYGHFASLTPFGVTYVDGNFVGVGGGQIGMTRHYIAGVGALAWGYEEVGWQQYNKDDLATVQALGVGPIGLLAPPYGGPGSAPS